MSQQQSGHPGAPAAEVAGRLWEELMRSAPTWRHLLGDLSDVGSYEEVSAAAEERHAAALRRLADEIAAVPEQGLDPEENTTREVVLVETSTRAGLLDARLAERGADPLFGPQAETPLVLGMLNVPDEDVAAAMPDKLRGLGRYYRELAERQRAGLERGWASPRFAVEQTVAQLDRILATPVDQDEAVGAIAVPDGADEAAWRGRWAAAVESEVRPGMRVFRDVLADEVLPYAPGDDRVGLGALPGGEDAYTATLRFFTTTQRTAAEIHRTGREQIEALAEEYRALGPEVAGTSDLAEMFASLRSDPTLHFRESAELVEGAKVAMARAEQAMPEWFEVLPRAACTITATEVGAKAFYFPPAPDGTRGGSFYINVGDPAAWGTFELEALTFHEAIPGHHLQLSVAAELPDSVPAIRRFSENAAYAEGWGLYTERLADEMGLYSSAVDRLGMLSADSLRACRLVVDTGLHTMGWSRQEAVDYMVANSPMTPEICQAEVDRYIVSPGQATSYMIGRLEIQRMRAEAEQAGGFDIRRFHSAVLDSGALPLAVLDRVVRERMAG